MDEKINKFLKNKKYKLATVKEFSVKYLLYVDDLKAWEEDTSYGEYQESLNAKYNKIAVLIEGDGFEISKEYDCIGRYYGLKPILSDYNIHTNKISVGTTIGDLYNFLEQVRGTSNMYIPYEFTSNKKDLNRKDLKLCYIESGVAYFTNNKDQWGDDWNDSPYECNAGVPYEEEGFELLRVGFYSNNIYSEPCSYFYNNNFTVEKINKKFVPWLIPDSVNYQPIFAEETIKDFTKKINDISGNILYNIEFKNYDY